MSTSFRGLRGVVVSMAGLSLVLSGCSVLQIRTAERDSGPMRIAVQKEAGDGPTSKSTEPALPPGMSETSINLGAECPVTVSFAIGKEWLDASTTEEFHVYSRGVSITDSDVVIVNCTQAFDDTPQAIIDMKKKYSFAEEGSIVKAEHTGTIQAGAYWTYQAVLGPSEIFAINQEPTMMYGARVGYKTNGRLVDIGIEMRALDSDAAAAADFKAMLPTIKVDGEQLNPPAFK